MDQAEQVELDRWIREAEARLREAQRTDDPNCIHAAEAALQEARDAVQQTRRVH